MIKLTISASRQNSPDISTNNFSQNRTLHLPTPQRARHVSRNFPTAVWKGRENLATRQEFPAPSSFTHLPVKIWKLFFIVHKQYPASLNIGQRV